MIDLEYLLKIGACKSAYKFVKNKHKGSLKKAWKACTDPAWLVWLVTMEHGYKAAVTLFDHLLLPRPNKNFVNAVVTDSRHRRETKKEKRKGVASALSDELDSMIEEEKFPNRIEFLKVEGDLMPYCNWIRELYPEPPERRLEL